MSKPVPKELATKNHHPRDDRIRFDEVPHIYYIDGSSEGYVSVTTFNHGHFAHFDADAVIANMVAKNRLSDPSNKYYGMTPEQIKEMWRLNGESASGKGTQMHYDIECYFNGWNVENYSTEFHYFLKFREDYPDLIPYRTEWEVFHEDVKIAGSIDMVFENPDGTIQIYDWKRCLEIPYEDTFSNKMATTECIKHLPDAKFWHYALQLNTYKRILEEKYGKKVTGLYLVALHPDNAYKTYDRIEVPFLDKEVDDLFQARKAVIQHSV